VTIECHGDGAHQQPAAKTLEQRVTNF